MSLVAILLLVVIFIMLGGGRIIGFIISSLVGISILAAFLLFLVMLF